MVLSKRMMEHPEKRYYKLNRFLLMASGLWPYQSVWSARLIRGIIAVITLSIIFVQLNSIFTSNIGREFMVFVIQALMITIGILYHIFIHIGNLDKFKKLFECMWQDWSLQKTDDEIRIMHQHAEITKLFTICYTLLTYGTMSMYLVWMYMPEILDVISPMNESRPRKNPFDYDFFIDEERYFYLIRFYMSIMFVISPLVFLAGSTLFLALTQHVCAMYKLLGYRAEHLFYVIGSAAENDLNCGTRIRCGNMAYFVRLHYNIIQFIDVIETCYTNILLVDLIGCICTLSFTLTQISSIIDDMEVAIRSISLTSTMLCYLFIHNYMGQRITDMNSSICEKVYNSAWYDAVISEQNSLLLIMRRSLHPLVLTACKFYVMSLQSFGMVLQMTISYCMFIKNASANYK
ncbi:odorant receptor 13a-like [Polyergus mexicanus]|uniref:odorant receptor 13a-like n=1 Tax=Polyergus mexicanus TaxID=615972 RepID=UPI0038B509F6